MKRLFALFLFALSALAQSSGVGSNWTTVTGTLQSAAVANGNGTALSIAGLTSALITVNCSVACTGGTTITFQLGDSNANYFPVVANQVGTNNMSATVVNQNTTLTTWQLNVAGATTIRSPISNYSAGTITVTATVIAGPPSATAPGIINANVATPVTAIQINNKVSAAAGTTITNAFTNNTTPGNSILCVGFEGPAATPVFTDAQSNVYNVALSSGAAAPGYTAAIASNIIGGTTDTITLTTTSGSASFTCFELKGAISVGQVWDYVAVAQGTAATLVFPQESAAIANDFVVAAVGMGAGTINATPSLAGTPSTLTTVDQTNTAPLSGGATPALSVFYSAHAIITNSPTFTQSLSLSASETYSAILIGVKPPSLSLVGNVQDPCQQGAGTAGNINLTAGGTLITGVAGKQTYICSMNLITATAQNIAIVEGTGTVCATNIAGMAGGSTAATGWNLAANDGLVYGGGGFWVFKTATAGDNVCLLLSSTGQTSGNYRQVQQ